MASQAAVAGNKLLWVDDQIQKFEPWVRRFTEQGVTVDTFRSLDNAIPSLDSQRYDAIFIDEMMPGQRGSDALGKLAVRAPDAQLYVCSAYFYLDDVLDSYDRRSRELKADVGRIDKTSLPLTDDIKAIKRFLGEVFSGEPSPEHVAQRNAEKLTQSELQTPVRWEDYSGLDVNGKLELHALVIAWTQEAREKAFSDGMSYLVFCGNWEKPHIARREIDEFLTESDLLSLARSTGYAPFSFSVGGPVDDLSTHCSRRTGMRGYPVLRMETRSIREMVHLDTGNPLSLLSYEHYTMNGWFDPALVFETHFAGELTLFGRWTETKGVVFTDSSEATMLGDLTAFAVMNWDRTRLSAACGPDCTTTANGGQNTRCLYRSGLLGRTLGDDLGCDFQVSLVTGAVHFRQAL